MKYISVKVKCPNCHLTRFVEVKEYDNKEIKCSICASPMQRIGINTGNFQKKIRNNDFS